MGLQGQAQGAVVLGGLPGGAHERQVDPGLGQVGPGRQGRVPVRPVGAGQSLHRPQGLAAAHPQAGEGVGLGQELHPPSAHHPGEVSDGAGPPGPGQDQALDVLLGQAPHLSQAQPHGPQPSAWNRLQGAVPVAGQDVGGAHLHPVLPGVPHQLGGRVEAHGLGVDQGGAEGVGPAPFHPGRGVDQQGEADGVALGEAVGAEPLDLAEAALGEVRVVAPPGHALQEAAAVFADAPQVAEGGHGPAQAVGVVLAEPGRLDGQAHGLLLEEGHAQGLAQYPVQLVRRAVLRRRGGEVHRVGPVAPAQVGVDHVALDGAGPDDGDLDHQVVEAPGLQARQHGHLGPALHLEDAHGVRPAQHVVDLRDLLGDLGDVGQPGPVRPGRDHLEGLAQGGQHAQGQDVHLHQAQGVDVVLVPLDEGAVRHGGVADRDQLVQPAPGQDIAAHVLGQVAGKAQELASQGGGPADLRGVRVQSRLADVGVRAHTAPGSPDRPGQGRGDVLGQAQGLAHLADGHPRPEVDHRGGDGGPVPAIAAEEVLHDLLPALVLEVDVDVRRLAPGLGDEAREQQVLVLLRRVDGGNAQAEADHGVGGRPAPLAQDALGPRPADDVVDGQEVVGKAQLLDEVELVLQGPPLTLAQSALEAPARPLPGQVAQVLDGGLAGRDGLVGVFVAQLRQVEADAAGDFQAALDGGGETGEQAGYLGRGLESPLGVGLQPKPCLMDRAALADAGQDVLQGPPAGVVVEHLAHGDQGCPGRSPQGLQPGQVLQVAGAVAAHAPQPDPSPPGPGQGLQPPGEVRPPDLSRRGRQDDGQLAFRMVQEVAEGQVAPTLGCPPLAQGQKAGQPAPGRPVGGIADEVRRPVGEDQAGARQNLQGAARLAPRPPGPDHPRQAVAVGDPQGIQAQGGGGRHQFLRVRGGAQEGEVAGRRQLGVVAHPNRPCSHQRTGRSWSCRPERKTQSRAPSWSSTR